MTIYALSSGPGVSGVAIIRISGPEAPRVIKSLTSKEIPVPRMATLRKINNINTSELIDEGLIIWFPGPESYTGEDWLKFMYMVVKLWFWLFKKRSERLKIVDWLRQENLPSLLFKIVR